MNIDVKICGITDAETARVAADAGARYLGFVFFDKSPRNLTIEAATALGPKLPTGPARRPERVGVFVNAKFDLIKEAAKALSLDWIQVHGAETREDIAQIKGVTGCRIIKAFGIASAEDFKAVDMFKDHVDAYLFDAKPPKGADLPGGNAISFPWALLKGQKFDKPWLLAGGLKAETIEAAIDASGATMLDVSSGVESAAGVKDHQKIQAFLDAAAKI